MHSSHDAEHIVVIQAGTVSFVVSEKDRLTAGRRSRLHKQRLYRDERVAPQVRYPGDLAVANGDSERVHTETIRSCGEAKAPIDTMTSFVAFYGVVSQRMLLLKEEWN